jgi:hypothetical protein
LFQLGLRCLGSTGLAENAIGVDKADFELLCSNGRCAQRAESQQTDL